MSWFSNLAETYDRVAENIGMNTDEEVLVPQNHMAANTNIAVTIDGGGNFRRAEADKKPVSIIIPCTGNSASRSVNISPHPLHENLGYLAMEEEKQKEYLKLLSSWCGKHPKAEAVYKYILSGNLLTDLEESKIEKLNEKSFVRFRVESDGDCEDIWTDPSLINAWQEHCRETDMKERVLCYAMGVPAVPAAKHPKGVFIPYNAKLISCNDETNFTYKGRFTEAEQANSISAEASHKAHAMLRYLINTQGYKCDTQAIVAWTIDDGSKQPDPFKSTYDLIDDLDEDGGGLADARVELATDYASRLCAALDGYGNANKLNISRHVAVLAIDSATTGRMGVTFYQDLRENEYVERIKAWHQSCRWWFYYDKHYCVSAPKADQIIAAVFGEPKGEGYKKIKKQARERLLHNILCESPIDKGWINAAVSRVSQPLSYDRQDGGWDKWGWETALNVACAIVRKFYIKKEEISLELDKTCNNRSYLYGRLLAIADKIESLARYLQTGGEDTEKRPTNAVRYMSKFAAKPFRTWNLIYTDQLNPYIQRLDGAEWYQRQIDEIIGMFGGGEFEKEAALDGRYLMGYSLQRLAFRNGGKDNEPDKEN